MNKEFFKALCESTRMPFAAASKIINGKYRPYLSALDDQYYQGNDLWDAKTNALNAAIKKFGKEKVIEKLSSL